MNRSPRREAERARKAAERRAAEIAHHQNAIHEHSVALAKLLHEARIAALKAQGGAA